jgi:ZIP family zinc transporter
MAALLGVALGVMATVSCVELVARNAMSGEADTFLVLAAAITGGIAYYLLEPLFPKMDEQHDHIKVRIRYVVAAAV